MTTTLTTAALITGAAATTAATIAIAAYSAQSQLFGPTLIACPNPNQAALTYDDGPNDNATPALLDLLAQRNTRATFFMIGRFVRQRPELVRRVHAAGHLIGNHTENHPWLTWKPESTIRQELRACNQALEDTIGEPIRYVRFPHGARRPATLRIARELGLTPVQWNVMGHDWLPIGADAITTRLEAGLTRVHRRHTAANILLHDGSDIAPGAERNATIEATRRLLQRFTTTQTQNRHHRRMDPPGRASTLYPLIATLCF